MAGMSAVCRCGSWWRRCGLHFRGRRNQERKDRPLSPAGEPHRLLAISIRVRNHSAPATPNECRKQIVAASINAQPPTTTNGTRSAETSRTTSCRACRILMRSKRADRVSPATCANVRLSHCHKTKTSRQKRDRRRHPPRRETRISLPSRDLDEWHRRRRGHSDSGTIRRTSAPCSVPADFGAPPKVTW